MLTVSRSKVYSGMATDILSTQCWTIFKTTLLVLLTTGEEEEERGEERQQNERDRNYILEHIRTMEKSSKWVSLISKSSFSRLRIKSNTCTYIRTYVCRELYINIMCRGMKIRVWGTGGRENRMNACIVIYNILQIFLPHEGSRTSETLMS